MQSEQTKIKICGMTTERDIDAVNQYLPDYVGFVLFFPKSKRNLTLERAVELKARLDSKISSVAVVVSPDADQARDIQVAGFDYVQIHGVLKEDVYEVLELPIIRAFNVSNMDQYQADLTRHKIVGFVFDSKDPGSGKTFDWNLMHQLPPTDKFIILAGGINEANVSQAVRQVSPYAIDLSSAVELADQEGIFQGKDPEKIKNIIRKVRHEE